ncbi:MAG: glycerol-3-phosphate acyltransferase PlsX [bacterium]|jgi:glycerol-3-phosphate acyltransferase PlsX
MTIALDVMGGDFAPQHPIQGAISALKELSLKKIVLVGDEAEIKKELNRYEFDASKIEIVHATQVVEMNESVVDALRIKKDSSMRVAYNLHKSGDVDGVISAGNSAAMLAIGKFVLKTIKGIDRPCISAFLPTIKPRGRVLLVDAGANMDCSPKHLLQFAFLGDVYAEYIHSIPHPRIGLLNVGAEEGKGNELVKETYHLLKKSSLNFIGNIEGKEFFYGDVDVVVTDGFSGNVLLKSAQGASKLITTILKEEINKSFFAKAGSTLLSRSLHRLKERTYYAGFNGAPLLGLRGVGVVCHGNSSPEAIQHGIQFCEWASQANMAQRVEEKILENQETFKP